MDHQSGSNSITPAAGPSQRNDFIPNNNLRISCSDCKTDPVNLVEEYASGDLVCGLCGLVLGDRIIDSRAECEFEHHWISGLESLTIATMYWQGETLILTKEVRIFPELVSQEMYSWMGLSIN